MGLGTSRDYYEPKPRRRSPAPIRTSPVRGGKRRRRRVFRRLRPSSATTQPVVPVRHHSPYRHAHRSRPLSAPIYPYGPVSQPPSVSMPLPYNNYTALPYAQPNQPMMITPQQQQLQQMLVPQPLSQPYSMMVPPQPITLAQFSQMMMPPQVPQSMMIPQYMPQSQNVMMPQQLLPAQPVRISQQPPGSMYSPYNSSPYAMNAAYSSPYMQPSHQQPQVQPHYHNIAVAPQAPPVLSAPPGPYYSTSRPLGPNLGTDWTGGGKISPGFLGPPL